MITLTLDDAEALEDMQILIRLAYQPTYSESLRNLGVERLQLLRLLRFADGYEMMACVESCVEELSSQLESLDDALAVFEAIPESLLERESCLSLVTKAASLLAKDLGPVEDLFTLRATIKPNRRINFC